MTAVADTAPEQTFAISRVRSKFDAKPTRDRLTWAGLCAELAKPRRAACSVADCGTSIHAELNRDGEVVGCKHKNGAGWIPATFTKGRKQEDVDHVSLLVVDGDHLPDDAALDTTLAQLTRYRYVAHGTHSDRPGNRCARIALPLSRPVRGAEWKVFWVAAMTSLGMPADPSCCDAGRLYYGPSRPRDADYWYRTNDGTAIDVDALLAQAPTAPKSESRAADSDIPGPKKPGERHAALIKLAGSMRRQSCDAATIYAALQSYNAKNCDPPKPDAELIEIAGYVGKKPSHVALAGGAVKMASDFVEKFCTHGGVTALRRWRGDWYRWFADRGHYTIVTDERIEASLYRDLNLARRADVGDVRHALIAATGVLIDEAELGTWLDDTKTNAMDIAPCANGLLHLPTRKLTPATPRYFATTALGVAYERVAAQPSRWIAFLEQLWDGDPESIAALQSWFGYLLSADTRHQKMLMLVGPKRSGKGTIARVLGAMLGVANVASPTLASLGTNFGLWPLIGKSAAIIGDARLGARSDIAQVVERLLSISGEDLQTVDRKHREPWTGKLSTRIMIISNELPRFTDASDALASRVLMLQLERSFYGEEDTGLTEALLVELPAILHWAIDGWDRLRKRGRFDQPTSSRDAIDDMIDLASPIAAWARQACITNGRDEQFWLRPEDAYAAFSAWCERNGHQHTPTLTVFGRDIQTATGCKRVQVTRGADRVRVYRGLELKP